MINANQYLKRRCGRDRSGERFYCRVPIPADLRGRFGLSLRSAGTFGPARQSWGIDFVAFFAPKMRIWRQNL